MKQFCKDAQEFAVKKAKSEQQKDEIKKNFKDIFKTVEKLKYDGKTKTT
jgi:hypothetical protein